MRCVWLLMLIGCADGDSGDTTEPEGTDEDTEQGTDADSDTQLAQATCADTLQLPDGDGCRAVNVFLIDDEIASRGGGERPSSTLLVPALESTVSGVQAFNITNIGHPESGWDGTIPSDTDVVFWAQGVDYNAGVNDTQLAAITAFVDAGGGLVRTEWGAAYSDTNPELSPVSSETTDYNEGDTLWTLATAIPEDMQAATTRLPATFTLSHGMTDVIADAGAVVLATVPYDADVNADPPAVQVAGLAVQRATASSGTITFLNHDLLYTDTSMTEAEVAPLMQAATWIAAAGL